MLEDINTQATQVVNQISTTVSEQAKNLMDAVNKVLPAPPPLTAPSTDEQVLEESQQVVEQPQYQPEDQQYQEQPQDYPQEEYPQEYQETTPSAPPTPEPTPPPVVSTVPITTPSTSTALAVRKVSPYDTGPAVFRPSTPPAQTTVVLPRIISAPPSRSITVSPAIKAVVKPAALTALRGWCIKGIIKKQPVKKPEPPPPYQLDYDFRNTMINDIVYGDPRRQTEYPIQGYQDGNRIVFPKGIRMVPLPKAPYQPPEPRLSMEDELISVLTAQPAR